MNRLLPYIVRFFKQNANIWCAVFISRKPLFFYALTVFAVILLSFINSLNGISDDMLCLIAVIRFQKRKKGFQQNTQFLAAYGCTALTVLVLLHLQLRKFLNHLHRTVDSY